MNKGRREGQGERANNNKEFSYVFVWCLFRSLIGPKSGQNPKKKKHPNLQPHLLFTRFLSREERRSCGTTRYTTFSFLPHHLIPLSHHLSPHSPADLLLEPHPQLTEVTQPPSSFFLSSLTLLLRCPPPWYLPTPKPLWCSPSWGLRCSSPWGLSSWGSWGLSLLYGNTTSQQCDFFFCLSFFSGGSSTGICCSFSSNNTQPTKNNSRRYCSWDCEFFHFFLWSFHYPLHHHSPGEHLWGWKACVVLCCLWRGAHIIHKLNFTQD